jgi:hypothetical protein
MTENVPASHPPGPHPAPEQLYRARRGPRTSEAERWLAHAAACALCTEEMLRQEAFDAPEPVAADRLAAAWKRFSKTPAPRATPAPLPPLAPVIPITRPINRLASIAQPLGRPPLSSPGRTGRAGLGLAAALVTAVVGLGLWGHTQAPQISQAPPAPQAPTLRGAAEPSGTWQPSGLLDAPPTEFRFPASPDGEPRRVTVFDAPRSYSWTSRPAAGGRVAFPAAEQKKLRRGVDYFWTVIDEENAAVRSFRLR